jgi:4-hydroxy-tetrahydrodipicolinate reductase
MLKGGGEAQPLQVVRIPFDKPRPMLHHPEDWLIKPDSWVLSEPLVTPEQTRTLQDCLALGPEILGDTTDKIPYPPIGAPPLEASLALVQPQNLRFVVKESKKPGEKRIRVNFELQDASYNLALTDIEWTENLQEQEFGEYSLLDLGFDPEAPFLLTISLSEPFQTGTGVNHCYKLVAAIFEAPEGWETATPIPTSKPIQEPEPEPALPVVQAPAPKPKPFPKPKAQPAKEPIRVAVCGAVGRMGREVVRAVTEAEGMTLVAAIDRQSVGEDAGVLAGCEVLGVSIQEDLATALEESGAEVLVDFTLPDSVFENTQIAIARGVSPVVGTTGLSPEQLSQIEYQAFEKGIGAFIAPNFAIGAVLMMEFAAQAAKYMPDVEIIELHHEKKIDSPSGTAILTAQKIAAARASAPTPLPQNPVEKVAGARGATLGEVPIHSVRLPGYVASQEVVFGGLGQILSLRHDSQDRRSFMPGVVLSVQRVRSLEGLVIGLEKLLF